MTQALVCTAIHQPLSYQEFDVSGDQQRAVCVQLKAAALNHRDLYISQGLYPAIRTPVVLGSDGAGLVGKREVIINPGIHWGNNPAYPSSDYQILGMPSHGTFARQVWVQADRLATKPAHLSFQQAAALPLAGLTAYRVLFSKCQLKNGEKVLISGIGGGVALMACQFAIAAGAVVYVTSGSEEKIEAARQLGAQGGANYKEADWHKTLAKEAGGFDVIIDSAGGEGFARLVRLCLPGARIGLYGGTRGAWQDVSPQLVFWRQISLLGSSMGNDEEFKDMIAFVGKHQIVPVVDSVFPLKKGNDALERMDKGLQFGKIVLEV